MKRDLMYKLTPEEFDMSRLEQYPSRVSFQVKGVPPTYGTILVGLWKKFPNFQDCIRTQGPIGLEEDIKKILAEHHDESVEWDYERSGDIFLVDYNDISKLSQNAKKLPLIITPDTKKIIELTTTLWKKYNNRNDNLHYFDDLTLMTTYFGVPLDRIEQSGLPKRLFVEFSTDSMETRQRYLSEKEQFDTLMTNLRSKDYEIVDSPCNL